MEIDQRPIIIAGGSGFLGQSLVQHLRAIGCDESVVVLTRGPSGDDGNVRYEKWDAQTIGDWAKKIDGAKAIVNVVGRTVDCVKNARNKKVILDSRIDSVRVLAEACNRAKTPPAVWVQAATAHIFGDTGEKILDESSPIGTGFAPIIGTAWEKAFNDADLPDTRRVTLRISFVIGRGGGALKTLALLTRLGLGGPTGSGKQYMSWVHEYDLNQTILRAIDTPMMDGIYVVTAPKPETNDDFMRMLRTQLRRPWSPRVPEWAVRVGAVFLRTDPELALYGRRCVPTRLTNEGFAFRFPDLHSALADLL